MHRPGLAASTLLAALWLVPACTVPDAPSRPSGGKADDADECAGAALDQDGVCRNAAGQFETASCCRQDVESTDLSWDVTAHTGRATVTMADSDNESIVLEIGDLTVTDVAGDVEGLAFEVKSGKLVVSAGGLPTSAWSKSATSIAVDYEFAVHSNFDGFIDAPLSDHTFTWPEFCANLFPCVSAPADGITTTMTLTGVPEGQTAVFPATIPAEAPSYMAAFTVGDYHYQPLGETDAGTEVGIYGLDEIDAETAAATDDLVAVFDFYEKTYGAYTFGDHVASVAVDWGEGGFGGMEHHPFWHIGRVSMKNKMVHHHEAAHGWFGNGVRLRCREDFVLSEGVASYLEARSTEATGGDPIKIWTNFQNTLKSAVASGDHVAYPAGCNEIASLYDIFSAIPYMKGAFFFRQVEKRIGRGPLDAALASFYQARVGTAASFDELVAHIELASGADLTDLVTAWLETTGIPCTLENGDCVD